MKKIIISSLVLFILASNSWASLFDGCLEKRLPREIEFKLMYDCVSSNCVNAYSSLNDKIEACSCLIGSIICEQGVDGAVSKAQSGSNACRINRDDKRLEKCLEKKKDRE